MPDEKNDAAASEKQQEGPNEDHVHHPGEDGNPLEAVPSLEMLFVQSVSSALEVASMLGMSQELFCSTMKAAWKIDDKRRQRELAKAKEAAK